MFWHVSVCLSTPGGDTPARSRVSYLGYPPPIRPGWGGYPPLGPPPPSDLARGTPPWVRPSSGLARGYPTSGTLPPPPVEPGWGGIPPWVVLDAPRSVCLLRSRRRTFLFALLSKTTSGDFILRILKLFALGTPNTENPQHAVSYEINGV